MQYMGDEGFLVLENKIVQMQRHLACSCKDCALDADADQECADNKMMDKNCRCQCRNNEQKNYCEGKTLIHRLVFNCRTINMARQ
jgi:uncharacterized membrane-anchored protein YhcB (DUF1043 family)